jgi:hypothetical protein
MSGENNMIRLFCLLMLLALPAQAQNPFLSAQWPNTDFSKTTVDLNSIRSGGPGKDGIPAVHNPTFLEVSGERRLNDREPVITVELQGQRPRAYPVRYFMVHEIVNDRIGRTSIAVTFCPLCNSGMVFDRRVGSKILSFGVSGNLRNSDMVMYDLETESWWQQAVGEGIVGRMAGKNLKQIPSWMESWADYKARNPDGLVLSAPFQASQYGHNPYRGYDSAARPFLYSGELPPHGIDPMERVIRVGNRAWPMTRLGAEKIVSEAGVRLSWEGEQASALDTAQISKGKSVGSIRVRDGSGKDVAHDVMFAFAYHAFFPDGRWMLPK